MALSEASGGRDGRSPYLALAGLLLLLVLFFLSRHLLHGQFGFYEDDWTLVVRGMASSWAEVRAYVLDVPARFAHQGRPLHHGPIMLLGHLAGLLGGRLAAYWLAFAMVALNIGLAYLLFFRVGGFAFALVGGLAFTLFSADTTQAYLNHAFGLQPALSFLLLACHAYLSQRRLGAHLLAIGALLGYESAYPVFMAAPLLEAHWDRDWRRRSVQHVLGIVAVLVLVAALRASAGEGRVGSLQGIEIVGTPIYHAIVGPVVALGSSLLRPLQAVQEMDLEVLLLSAAAAAAIGYFVSLTRAGKYESPVIRDRVLAGLKRALRLDATDRRREVGRLTRLIRLGAAGIGMLILAYPLTFTVRPYAISGRDSRVHFAAVLGFALVWAAVTGLALLLARRSAVRKAIVGLVALLFGLHVGFGLIVQRDYARAWDLQQRFWSSLVPFVPDVSDGTVIFVEPSGLQDTQYIGANTWYLPLVFQYVYQFPQEWEEAPRVYRLAPHWPTRVLANPAEVKLIDVRYDVIAAPKGRTILLGTENGQVVARRSQLEATDGSIHELGPAAGRGEPPFGKGILYKELVQVHR